MRLRRRDGGALVVIILLMLSLLGLVGAGVELVRSERHQLSPVFPLSPLTFDPPINLPRAREPQASPAAPDPHPPGPSLPAESPRRRHTEPEPTPAPPLDLRAEASREGGVVLTWSPAPGPPAIAFEVRRDGAIVHEGVETRFADVSVQARAHHCWEVRALDTAMRASAPVSVCAAARDVTPPRVPLDVVVRVAPDRSVDLSWTVSADDAGAVSYDVLESADEIATVTRPAWRGYGLVPGTQYCYSVRARDDSGNRSAASPRVCVTPAPPPPSPPARVVTLGDRDLSATVSRENVRLVWRRSSVEGVVYRVYTADGKVVGATAANTFVHTRIDGGAQCYRIRAMDRDGRESSPTRPLCVPELGASASLETPAR